MQIKDVEALAEFAKIELTTEEKEELLKDMEGILAYVRQIEEVEVKEEEAQHAHRNIWREDLLEDGRSFAPPLLASQFPDNKDDYAKVKKIL